MIKFFRDHQILVVKRQQPLRVRITARAEEIRESILNKRLELIGMKHELASLEETKQALENWLQEIQDDEQTQLPPLPTMPAGLREAIERSISGGPFGDGPRPRNPDPTATGDRGSANS